MTLTSSYYEVRVPDDPGDGQGHSGDRLHNEFQRVEEISRKLFQLFVVQDKKKSLRAQNELDIHADDWCMKNCDCLWWLLTLPDSFFRPRSEPARW